MDTSVYFSDPMKIICSKKCARPGISGGSLKLPTPTVNPHAACVRNMRSSTLRILIIHIFFKLIKHHMVYHNKRYHFFFSFYWFGTST